MSPRIPRRRSTLLALLGLAAASVLIALAGELPPFGDASHSIHVSTAVVANGGGEIKAGNAPHVVLGTLNPTLSGVVSSAAQASSAGLLYTIDQIDPVSSVGGPLTCANPQSLGDLAIFGDASDRIPEAPENGFGVRKVEIRLQDAERGLYWNQSEWTTSPAWIPVEGKESWSVPAATIADWQDLSDADHSAWRVGSSYLLQARAVDLVGNREDPSAADAVLFSYLRDAASSKIDFPEGGTLYNDSDNSVCRIRGFACPAGGAPIDEVRLKLEVTTTTHPDQDDRFGKFWDGSDWVDAETWITADGSPNWEYSTETGCGAVADVPFGCPSGIADCGHGITVTSRARDVGGVEEPVGNSIEFFFDVVAPLVSQTFPPGGDAPYNRLFQIKGQAKDCGDPLMVMKPRVEVQVVRLYASGDDFVESGIYWQGGATWSTAEHWEGAFVEPRVDLVPFEACPAEGFSYDWVVNQNVEVPESTGSGYHYRVKVRAIDDAENTSSTKLGARFLFDNTPPNPPSPLTARSEDDREIASGVWQNITGKPTFSWQEPFDDCDPSSTGCFLNDASRTSSGIREYDLYYGPDEAGPPTTALDPSQTTFDTGADPGPGGVSHFRIHAQDRAGNTSALSTFAVKFDATPPVVTVTYPVPNSVLYKTSLVTAARWIRGKAFEAGTVQSGLTGVELMIQDVKDPDLYWNGASKDWVSDPTWNPAHVLSFELGDWEYDTSAVSLKTNHDYAIHARSTDLAGNTSAVVERPFQVRAPRVVNLFLPGDKPPSADFWQDYNISMEIMSPLTEDDLVVAITSTEAFGSARTAFGRTISTADFLGTYHGDITPPVVRNAFLPRLKTTTVTFSYDHDWEWLATYPVNNVATCIQHGVASSIPGLPNVIAGIFVLEGILAQIDATEDSLMRATFEYDFTSDLEIYDLDATYRTEEVVVPIWKPLELHGGFVVSLAATATSLVATVNPEPISKGLMFAAEAIAQTSACLAQLSAADPDPDYQVIVMPEYVSVDDVTTEPSLLNDPFARDTLQLQLDRIANQKALFAARNKFWGAKDAEDIEWMLKQSAAMRAYGALVAEGWRALADRFDSIRGSLEDQGFELNAAMIEQARQEIAANGLPEVEKEILRAFGYSEADIELYGQTVATTPISNQDLIETFTQIGDRFRYVADEEPDDVLLFFDNFDDGVLDGWEEQPGPWLIVPPDSQSDDELDRVLQSNLLAPARISTLESFSGGIAVEAMVHPGDAHFVTVRWGVQDASNYYEFVIDANGGGFVNLVQSGVVQPLGTTGVVPDLDWHWIRVESAGGTHSFWVDTEESTEFPGEQVPRKVGEVTDSTFTSGAIGLGAFTPDDTGDFAQFDDVKVSTTTDGTTSSQPALEIAVSPPNPADTDPVTFEVTAPANAVDVRLYVDGRQVRQWENEGGVLQFTGGPFDGSCHHTYVALAITADGLVLTGPADRQGAFDVADTTDPHLSFLEPVVSLEAQECDATTGWRDYNPWQNTTFYDLCDVDPTLAPPSDPPTRFFLGTSPAALGVTDASGNETTGGYDVEVVNTPPSIAPLAQFDGSENDAVSVSATADDPRTRFLDFVWGWGDGTPDTVQRQDQPASADAFDPFSATDAAMHVYGDDGVYPVTLTVRDDCGGETVSSTLVTVENVDPVIDVASFQARVDVDVTLYVAGPPGALVERRDDGGSPEEPVYREGFTAKLLVFENGSLLASADLTEQQGVSPESVTIEGSSLDLEASHEIRIVYTSAWGAPANAWVELRSTDGAVRTFEHLFFETFGASEATGTTRGWQGGQHVTLLDGPYSESFRSGINGILYGAPGEGEAGVSLAVQGLLGPVPLGKFAFTLRRDGTIVATGSRDLTIISKLLPPSAIRIDLPDVSLSAQSTYESEVVSSLLGQPVPGLQTRVSASGGAEDVYHLFAGGAEVGDCRGQKSCTRSWTAKLDALFFGMPIRFEASASDAGSDDLTFRWTWDEGTDPSVGTHYNDGIGPDPFPSPEVNPIEATDSQGHRYTGPGEHTITLEVEDDDGGTASAELAVVRFTGTGAPVIDPASLAWDETAPAAAGLTAVEVVAQAVDADSDIVTCRWDWGDGTQTSEVVRFQGDPLDGAPFLATCASHHDYTAAGSHYVVLTVEDDRGASDSLGFQVTTTD